MEGASAGGETVSVALRRTSPYAAQICITRSLSVRTVEKPLLYHPESPSGSRVAKSVDNESNPLCVVSGAAGMEGMVTKLVDNEERNK